MRNLANAITFQIIPGNKYISRKVCCVVANLSLVETNAPVCFAAPMLCVPPDTACRVYQA